MRSCVMRIYRPKSSSRGNVSTLWRITKSSMVPRWHCNQGNHSLSTRAEVARMALFDSTTAELVDQVSNDNITDVMHKTVSIFPFRSVPFLSMASSICPDCLQCVYISVSRLSAVYTSMLVLFAIGAKQIRHFYFDRNDHI
jgi:hypothetical protein